MAQEHDTKVLRVGLLAAVETFDPRNAQQYASALVLGQVFEPPVARDPESDATVPVLFDGPLELESRDGRAVYRGRVRAGVKFSDGTELTARIVADSLAKARTLTEMANVAVDGNVVTFTLDAPNPRFEATLSQRWCAVTLERGGDTPLGTGAYAIADDSTPQRVRLIKNPHYRDDVAIDEVVFEVFPPGGSGVSDGLIQAVAAGDIDFTPALSREEVGQLEGVRKLFQPGTSTAILFFNTERPFFANADVRRALGLAIDRYKLAAISYPNAAAFAARSLLPPRMTEFRERVRHAPDEARKLLDESGESQPSAAKLLVVWGPRPYLPHPDRAAEAIRDQLAELGVEVEIVHSQSTTDYFNQLRAGAYDMVLGGWIADTPDPADFLDATLSSALIPTPQRSAAITCNSARWDDPETDAALRAYRANPSAVTQATVLERIADQVPLVPLMYGPTVVVHAWRVKNLDADAVAFPSFAALDIQD